MRGLFTAQDFSRTRPAGRHAGGFGGAGVREDGDRGRRRARREELRFRVRFREHGRRRRRDQRDQDDLRLHHGETGKMVYAPGESGVIEGCFSVGRQHAREESPRKPKISSSNSNKT